MVPAEGEAGISGRALLAPGRTTARGAPYVARRQTGFCRGLCAEQEAKRTEGLVAPAGMVISRLVRRERNDGADRGNRTPDPRITNALLYQLSYVGTFLILALPSLARLCRTCRYPLRHPGEPLAAAPRAQLSYFGTLKQEANYKGRQRKPTTPGQSRRLRTRMMTSMPSGCIPSGSWGSLEKATSWDGMSCSSPLSTL